jgi:hypothetical protein
MWLEKNWGNFGFRDFAIFSDSLRKPNDTAKRHYIDADTDPDAGALE